MKEKDLVASLLSFIKKQPAHEEIIALESVTVCGISYEKLHEMYKLHPESNQIGYVFLEQYSTQTELSSLILRSNTALQKYKLFCKYYEDLLGRVSQKQIASFLGMSQETFCRIRNAKQVVHNQLAIINAKTQIAAPLPNNNIEWMI